MDAQIKAQCQDNVLWHPFTKRDGAGDKTFSPAIPLLVYLNLSPGLTISRDGVDVTVKGTILVDGSSVPGLSKDDEFEVSGLGRVRILQTHPLRSIQGEGARVVIYL
jgi:hypothetical protein